MKPKSNTKGNIYAPQGIDACQTPSYALNPLLPHLSQHKKVWESACGEGYMSRALEQKGYEVISSDIVDTRNFLTYEPELWDCIVTNPPYSIKYKWIERCYALGKPFALLLPVETLGAKTAQVMMQEHGVEIILLNQRVDFKMPNKGWLGSSAQFPVMWFTWKLDIGQQLTFASIIDAKREFKQAVGVMKTE